jgi:hypothetical protein
MERAALDLFLPAMESAVVIAAHYAKACDRPVLAQDVCMGLMFAARHVVGKQIGSLFPEIYESDEESQSDSELEEVDDSDYTWTRYDGPDETLQQVNLCAATWNEWEPENPAELALKSAVEKTKEKYGWAEPMGPS